MQKTKVRLLAILLAFVLVLGLFPGTALATDEDITVYMSFEGFTIGYGFFVEPVLLTLSAGTNGQEATQYLLDFLGYDYEYTSNDWGFFLNRISGFDVGDANPPEFILAQVTDSEGETDWGGTLAFDPTGSEDGSLGGGDFFGLAGWMVTVNHELLGVSVDDYTLEDGDVLRWQFSLLGGDDLGAPGGWQPSFYNQVDKSALIRALFTADAAETAVQAALAVIINPLATGAEVASALAALTPAGAWQNPFPDVAPSAWFFDAVQFVAQNGLMQGTPVNFSPNTNLSRAMIVTILWRYAGEPVAEGETFTDVQAGRWYTEAISWASANEIMRGYGGGRFGPNDNVTREQFAVILQNFAVYRGYDVEEGSFVAEFTDVDAVSNWAVEAMEWANANGLINGRTPTTLVPRGSATRAESAAILYRFIETIAGGM